MWDGCGLCCLCTVACLCSCDKGAEFVATDFSEQHAVTTVLSVGFLRCIRVNKAADAIVAFCRGLYCAIGIYVYSDGIGSATLLFVFIYACV